jgi:hypothetical protein
VHAIGKVRQKSGFLLIPLLVRLPVVVPDVVEILHVMLAE